MVGDEVVASKEELSKALTTDTKRRPNLKILFTTSATTSFIINHIMKTYTRGLDVAEALEKLEELDFTTSKSTLKKSKTDADLKKIEEK